MNGKPFGVEADRIIDAAITRRGWMEDFIADRRLVGSFWHIEFRQIVTAIYEIDPHEAYAYVDWRFDVLTREEQEWRSKEVAP